MNENNYLYSLLRYLHKSGSKNFLLKDKYLPYDIDLKTNLSYFDQVSSKFLTYVNTNILANNEFKIVNLANEAYLIRNINENIHIRLLEKTREELSIKQIHMFTYGVKNLSLVYKSKSKQIRHLNTYKLINSIRKVSDGIIVIAESDKHFIHKDVFNLFSFYKPGLNVLEVFRHIENIDFEYLLLPDTNNIEIISELINIFPSKKIFISTKISFGETNSNMIICSEDNNEDFKNKIIGKEQKLRFRKDIFNKTIGS